MKLLHIVISNIIKIITKIACKGWEKYIATGETFSSKIAQCQVTEHCYHPSLNAQYPYEDYSLLLAASDISRLYIPGRTIHLWIVQVTNAEYIVLRATFGSFDASSRCSHFAGGNFVRL